MCSYSISTHFFLLIFIYLLKKVVISYLFLYKLDCNSICVPFLTKILQTISRYNIKLIKLIKNNLIEISINVNNNKTFDQVHHIIFSSLFSHSLVAMPYRPFQLVPTHTHIHLYVYMKISCLKNECDRKQFN